MLRDGHIAVDNAYYSTPTEYLGRCVWVRWDSRFVRIFNKRMEQVAVHVRVEPGRFSTHDGHIEDEKRNAIERGEAWLLAKSSRIGPETARWAHDLVRERGVYGVRPLQGLLSLARDHRADDLERACAVASSHRAYRLQTIRHLLKNQDAAKQTEFLDEHALIRDMTDYADIIASISNKNDNTVDEDQERMAR